MASGNQISCKQFANFLVEQTPIFDEQILSDIRPATDGLVDYYGTKTWSAYDGATHTFDRFTSVFPDVTAPWNAVEYTDCTGTPCDPDENKIGWGSERNSYSLEKQAWASDVLCFDQIMHKNKAKQHFRQIIDQILRPATLSIYNFHSLRKAAELAENKILAAAGLPKVTYTWVGAGYRTLEVRNAAGNALVDPTGILTPPILKKQIFHQYSVGAVSKKSRGFGKLELHTDIDTFDWMCKQDPTIYDAWRHGNFAPAAQEFWKYGFYGYIGDYMVKTLMHPIRFQRVSTGVYRTVLPYTNEVTSLGLKSVPNEDYEIAQYQWSYINHRDALVMKPFQASALAKEATFKVRSFQGNWQFVTNDLGADCNGKVIENSRSNKGKFIADFMLGVKPERPEWLVSFFHKRDYPCVVIIDTCNADPGYSEQSMNAANALCPTVMTFTAVADDGTYAIAADGVTCDGNIVTITGGISEATLALFVADLQTGWEAAGKAGEWEVDDADAGTITLTDGDCATVNIAFLV